MNTGVTSSYSQLDKTLMLFSFIILYTVLELNRFNIVIDYELSTRSYCV